ncbi:tRNA (adenine(22)-N(1))-methyltransferase [Desulfosporosinus metallidurans]|uniref:Putative tRNA-m1A22 methylase n=1 Tax=Desulfosporosinus metallidurans TaxID=1888891 RepID=A0A1Q8R1S7_9FIRM|nr:class I SAM-dependent methyltransferase [Desulfosporosinus metallidurans]OLN33542.1 putative tRNA-m1A22 methylase [Desulfosporosinus metallidurans]
MTISVILGPRLQTVASFVPEGAKLGDIGTDHAYLPIALYEAHRIYKAVAIDVHEGPYQSALSAVKGRYLEDFIEVRLGDGLKPLMSGEVDVLTLAGMGGRTMLEILSARPDVVNSLTDLIVQPQGAEGAVRLALLENGWRLKAERLVEEENRLYVVMAYSKETGWDEAELLKKENEWNQRLQPLLEQGLILDTEFSSLVHMLVWHFGPLVLENRSDLLNSYLNEYRSMLSRRLEQMKKSKSIEIEAKLKEVCAELALVEGIRTWQ